MTAITTRANQLQVKSKNELARMDNQALLNELRVATAVTAASLVYMAQIWQQLESRGMDMTPYRNGLMRFLPLIASGNVIPDAVIKFAGNLTLINQVAKMPPERQQALADGEVLPVLDPDTGAIKELKAEELTTKEVRQIFGSDGQLRDIEQQQRLASYAPRKDLAGPKIAISERTGMVSVGSQQASISDLLLILKQHGYTVKKKAP